jgi:hypothetical protein
LSALLKKHLQTRGRAVLWIAAAAVATQLLGPAAPEPTVQGVTQLLARSMGGKVGAFYWERSGGVLSDLLVGRRIVFLATPPGETLRDVFRARVRVDRRGRPLSVAGSYNLTRTSRSDEHGLVVRDGRIAFLSRAFDAVQGVNVFDLDAPPAASTWLRRLAASVRCWTRVGSLRPVRRRAVVFRDPPRQAEIELRTEGLVMALGTPPRAALLDLTTSVLDTGGEEAYGAHAFEVPIDTSWCSIAGERVCAAASRFATPAVLRIASRDSSAPPPAIEVLDAGAASGVSIVSIDTRRLRIGIVAGYAQPQAQAGPGGTGRVPAGQRQSLRATFGGGATPVDPHAGLVVQRRVLVPLERGRPSVAIDEHGHAFVGTWHGAEREEPLGRSWHSVFQGRDILVRDAKAEPPTRHDTKQHRAALCLSRKGFLLYASGRDVTRRALAAALVAAGCDYALAIDRGAPAEAFRLHDEPAHGIAASSHSHFYLSARDLKPRDTRSLQWTIADGEQPAPSWLPSVFTAKTNRLGAALTLYAITPGHLRWTLRAGTREVAARTADSELSKAEHARANIALNLGIGRRGRNRRGLVLAGVLTLPLRPDFGVLLSDAQSGALHIGVTSPMLIPRGDASELALLAVAGKLRNEARTLGAMRQRSAMCKHADATLYVAHATHDNAEPLARSLLEVGCTLVVALDRGLQADATIHRAGSEHPPRAQYDDTTLYGLSTEPRGTARALP